MSHVHSLLHVYLMPDDPQERENVFGQHPEAVAAFKGCLEWRLGKLPYEIRHSGDKRLAPPLWWTYRRNTKKVRGER